MKPICKLDLSSLSTYKTPLKLITVTVAKITYNYRYTAKIHRNGLEVLLPNVSAHPIK